MKLGHLIATGCLLQAASLSATAGPVLDRIQKDGRIVIAYRESSVPFSYLNANKKPVGYAIELCHRLAEAVRKKVAMSKLELSYTMVTPANRINKIADGQADLECGSTTNNAERRQKVAFTVPHYITGARYLVRSNAPIEELRDFEKRSLASTKGTTVIKAIDQANRERLLGIKISEVPDHAKGVEMVERGEVDGFAMDDVLLYGLRAGRQDPNKLKVVGKFLTIEPLAIMLSKDDPAFKQIVDEAMKRLIASREAHAIYEKWFIQPIPPKNASLNLPMNYLLKDFWKYPTDQVPF